MVGNSMGRRSSTNPVRVSLLDKEDKSSTRGEPRRTQTLKPKIVVSSTESSHIPRAKFRASSCDRTSGRKSTLKTTGRTPLRHVPATPNTPIGMKHSMLLSSRIHSALPTGRRSLSADRASSIGPKGPRRDTRLLVDKGYQAHMLAKIDNYFAAHDCSSMLNSNGSLKPITLKMFVDITAHLVKMLDIKQTLTITNYIEEIPKIAKKLHYLGIVNKSWLKTANAMHSWPNVLGWICWLVDICEIKEIAFEKYSLEDLPFTGNETEAMINKKALFSMFDFYKAWNDEKLDEEAALVERYLQEFKEQHGVNEEKFNNVRSGLEEKLAKLKVTEENANVIDEEVKQLQKRLSTLQLKEAEQLNKIEEKENLIKTITFETEQLNSECNMLREQIRLQNAQKDKLLATVEQQPLSTAERDKILEECTEIQNYMQQFDDHLGDIQQELYTMDLKLASINNSMTKSVLMYNKEIFMHLSDCTGLDLEQLKMPEKGLLHPQIIDVLKSKAELMDSFKERLKKQMAEKEHLLEVNSNELENLQERIKILEDEKSDAIGKIQEKKNLISKIRADAKNEEAKLKEQIKILQNDIKSIQESIPDMQQLFSKLEETTDKLDAVQRRKAYIEESAKLFFEKFYKILGEHRTELYNILKKHDK